MPRLLPSLLLSLLQAAALAQPRTPPHPDLPFWLANMTRHDYTLEEMSASTGLPISRLRETIDRERLHDPHRLAALLDIQKDKLLILPYPGGRHPRIGFLDGAIDPQRETKFSLFAPWDPTSYAVIDVPEAIFTHLGLTYLAHTHIPTIWSAKNIQLEKLEWQRHDDGSLSIERRLPNGIVFATSVTPQKDVVWIDLAITNNTDAPLTDIRIQVCTLLKGLKGFAPLHARNLRTSGPYAAVRSSVAPDRWLITAFHPLHRTWHNPPVPCIHSDPKMPDCQPNRTQRVRGFVRFYEGKSIKQELERLEATRWTTSQP